ncbi:MAG: carbon storage regulator [Firmicutes bacterium]|nr:carbon storage regulator [Bacillota bacterium]
MLVLTRKASDAIVLFWEPGPGAGDAPPPIHIRVLEVSGETVRLGIEAPAQVRVLREEVWLATQANQAAADSPPPATLPPAPGSRPAASHPLVPTAPRRRTSPPVPPGKPGSR